MKLIKKAEGKQAIVITREEWTKIGSDNNWGGVLVAKNTKDTKKKKKVDEDVNPRGEKRPKDGRGKGKGMSGGQKGGKMDKPCPTDEGPGYGQGGGKGKGKNR